jgi:hypothetical protein
MSSGMTYLEKSRAERAMLSERASAMYQSILNDAKGSSPMRVKYYLPTIVDCSEEEDQDSYNRRVFNPRGVRLEPLAYRHLSPQPKLPQHQTSTDRLATDRRESQASSPSKLIIQHTSSTPIKRRLQRAYGLRPPEARQYSPPPRVNYLIPVSLREDRQKTGMLKPVLYREVMLRKGLL